jgi:ubiquinone/menaquinone biosynthesis C-methylase UbiE
MGLSDACFRLSRAMQGVLVPQLRYSQSTYEEVLREAVAGADRWLDLGCGHQLLPAWRQQHEKALIDSAAMCVGLDYDESSLKKHHSIRLRVRGDISRLPFKAHTFDLVTSNMVFEHLKEPRLQLEEIFRILKPGGRLLFHTPNVDSYGPALSRRIPEPAKRWLAGVLQDREDDDIFPAYYKINTRQQIDQAARQTGFTLESLRFIVSTPVLAVIPPLALLELLYIRFLMTQWGTTGRPNIIARLQRPHSST